MILYHATSSDYRPMIARHGLLPAHPATDGNFTDYVQWSRIPQQRRGVYGFTRFREAIQWPHARNADGDDCDIIDVWACDHSGIDYYRDPLLDGARVIPQRIPPSRLLRIDEAAIDRARASWWRTGSTLGQFGAYCDLIESNVLEAFCTTITHV